MIDVDKAVASRLKKGKKRFEVLVDPVKALDFKRSERVEMDEVLAYPDVYYDVRRGNSVPEKELQEVFGTTDVHEIAKKIIKQGKMQFTTEQKRRFREEKTKEIANIISRQGIDPQTNTRHPPERILNAMKKAGVRVEPFLDASLQVNEVVEALKPLLPISFQKVVVRITIPPRYTGKSYPVLKRMMGEFKENWLNDGSLQVILDIPAGLKGELFKKMGDVTRGNFRSEVLKRVDL